VSTLKVDTINTSDGTGNITVSRPLSGSGASLTSLPAGNLTGTVADARISALTASKLTGALPAISGASLTNLPAGRIVQIVNVQTGAVATGTTIVPADDTIPQNTEGIEVMTLAITPTNASNILEITAITNSSNGDGSRWAILALFQDSTAGALAAATGKGSTAAQQMINVILKHRMVAGTTSATTFKIRLASQSSGTLTFNGYNGGRTFGGVMASSITIKEITV